MCELAAAVGPGVYDPETMSTSVTAGLALWSGACRVTADPTKARSVDQGGQDVTSRDYLVQLAETGTPVPDVRPGWVVTITACPDDDLLVGRHLTVTDVRYGSMRWTRDLVCDDNLD